MTQCLNCDEEIHGKYCHNCGQKTETERITLKKILSDLPLILFNWEKGLLYNIQSIFVQPGKKINAYLDGKRIRFFLPFQYALLWSGILIFLDQQLDVFNRRVGSSVDKEDLYNEKLYQFGHNVGEFMFYNISWFWPLLILFLALASYLVFHKRGRNFAEHLYINAFVVGHITLISIVIFPVSQYFLLYFNPLIYLLAIFFLSKTFKKTSEDWFDVIGLSFLAAFLGFLLMFLACLGGVWIFY